MKESKRGLAPWMPFEVLTDRVDAVTYVFRRSSLSKTHPQTPVQDR